MQYALAPDGTKIEAAKGLTATCPNCGAACRPKCGQIKIHHWAHVAGVEECDTWWEPETEWHRAWKALFKPEFVEVVMGPHRADVSYNGTVVELQNSPISPADIKAREQFYGNMIWIVNASRFADRFFLMKLVGQAMFNFKWKHMRPIWLGRTRPLYLDFGHVTVQQLLGGSNFESSTFYNSYGVEESYDRTTIVRYHGSSKDPRSSYSADDQFEHLKAWLKARTILKVNTIHANGNGSVVAVDREELIKSYGLSAARQYNLAAFR